MNKNISKKLAKSKKKISKKLKKRNWTDQPAPMFKASNIQYEIDGRLQGISHGGIGLIHMLAKKTGLLKEIDKELELLKRHLPYHESDHVANMAYNILAGGTCLQDIELLRNDDAWLTALDAKMIPDPTTAGDFLRRFSQAAFLSGSEGFHSISRNGAETLRFVISQFSNHFLHFTIQSPF